MRRSRNWCASRIAHATELARLTGFFDALVAGLIDDTLKHLTELSPSDWVVQGGWPAAPATVIDADIATISGATDKVIHVDGPVAWLLAVDFQSGHDTHAKLPDLLLYNRALFRRHHLHVRSLLVLLHRGADSPQVTGVYQRGFAGEPANVMLRYGVLRVWQCRRRHGFPGAWALCRWRRSETWGRSNFRQCSRR